MLNGSQIYRRFSYRKQRIQDDIILAPDSGDPRTVHLSHVIPVYILYRAAWVDEEGILQFRHDAYGLDEQLWTVLHHILDPSVSAGFPKHFSL